MPQRLRRLPKLAASELFPTTPEEFLEAIGVERARPQTDGVAASLRHEDTFAHRSAQPRRNDMDGVLHIPRACVSPQLVCDAFEADDRAAVHEKQCQERERPATRDASVPATR